MTFRLALALPVAAVLAAAAPAAVAQSAKDVVVVNGPSQSVPVTGTVGLAAGAQVGVSGPVSLAPGTRVEVVSAPPVPFQRQVLLEWNATDVNTLARIAVPEGKRLVIEHVEARIGGPETQAFFVILMLANDLTSTTFSFRTVPPGFKLGGSWTHQFSATARLYHDGPSDVLLNVYRTLAGEATGGSFSVSGHLVDLP